MSEFSTLAGQYKKSVEDHYGFSSLTKQDLKNFKKQINHWISDENSGRAYFPNIKNSTQVTIEWIDLHLSAVRELAKTRQVCQNCTVESVIKCPKDKKARSRVRNFEDENGLARGTVNPSLLKSKVCIKNCATPGKKSNQPVYTYKLVRPNLVEYGKILPGYESCPVRSSEWRKGSEVPKLKSGD